MNNPLLRKLANFTQLSEDESNAVNECSQDVREFAAGEDVISQGDRTGGVKLLLDGFACRYKVLEDGRRQIVAFHQGLAFLAQVVGGVGRCFILAEDGEERGFGPKVVGMQRHHACPPDEGLSLDRRNHNGRSSFSSN